MISLPDLKKAQTQGKKVFLRLDLDVPRSEYEVFDTTRIDAGFPTLEYLVQNSSAVIIGSHLGRPQGYDKNFSLRGVGLAIAGRLGMSDFKEEILAGFMSFKIGERINLLENLRFYEEEEKNDPEFSKKLASLSDIYVNEAFAVSHRNHASVVGVPAILPHFAGFRLKKEVEELSKVIESPLRPLVVVIGGAKIETKLPLVDKMLSWADKILVGGEIAAEISSFENPNEKLVVAELSPEGTDITKDSIQKFGEQLKIAKTIVWNGPMGEISKEINKSLVSEAGTQEIAQFISKSNAHTIVGGGDTIAFLNKHGLLHKFFFVSMGGGAMLAFLAGENLPGLEALIS